MSESRYWRIRMKYGGEELTREAWERNEVGIWYGSWTAEELESARKRAPFAVSFKGKQKARSRLEGAVEFLEGR